MRLFIAVCFPEEVKKALRQCADNLVAQGVRGNVTPSSNMHLTLAFLGEVKARDMKKIHEAMDRVSFSPFTLSFEGSGRFRDLCWVGLKESKELKNCTDSLRRELNEQEIEFDPKPFKPHITIIRKAQNLNGKEPLIPKLSFPVNRISLMKSERIEGRMKYTEIYAVQAGCA